MLLADRPPALPATAVCYREIGPFTAETLPSGLLREHRLKEDAWAILTVEAGAIRFVWDDAKGGSRALGAGQHLLVPPCVPHHLDPAGPVRLRIGFYRAG